MGLRLVGVVSSLEDARSIVFNDSRLLVYRKIKYTRGDWYRILELS